jgi:hypothetical protein
VICHLLFVLFSYTLLPLLLLQFNLPFLQLRMALAARYAQRPRSSWTAAAC